MRRNSSQSGRIIRDVRMIELRTLFEWVPLTSKNWTQEANEGGLILDQGAHNFDFLRWFASSEATRVFGRVKQFGECGWPSSLPCGGVLLDSAHRRVDSRDHSQASETV